jgi:hypothetical protein
MNISEELEKLSKGNVAFSEIQKYLIDCVSLQLKYRSKGKVEKAIEVSKQCLDGKEDWSKLHRLQWYIEAEAFEVDHFIENISNELPDETIADLEKVEIDLSVSRDKALLYVRDLAYFIDSVFSSVAFPENGIPHRQYNQFFNLGLFIKYFHKDA